MQRTDVYDYDTGVPVERTGLFADSTAAFGGAVDTLIHLPLTDDRHWDPYLIGGLLLRNWNLPKQVWQSIEYQEYPKFAPPSEVPEDLLPNVALLYVAHLCFDTFSGKTNGMKSPFQSGYIKVLGFENTSIEKITKQRVIPTLMKNMDGFPAFFRKYLTAYMRSHMAT